MIQPKKPLHIILYHPEIPANTGNIIRLCANIGASLHLIKPLSFELDDKRMRRAGLDYHEFANIKLYDSLAECLDKLHQPPCFAFSTKATSSYHEAHYTLPSALLFGPETRGLPLDILSDPHISLLRLPMTKQSRSLNLSNSVAIAAYEMLRQCSFPDLI